MSRIRHELQLDEPSQELMDKIRRARDAIANQKPRYVKCPLLASGDRDHILSGVFNQFLSEKSEPAE